MSTVSESIQWNEHWNVIAEPRSLFGLAALAARRLIFQPAVAHYAKHVFPEWGTFVEMGCGTAESSAKLPRARRKLIGLDCSAVALRTARQVGHMDSLLQADLFSLPCRGGSVDGIWNLGVMEHFAEPQIRYCLQEFHRILKPGGSVILFWPSRSNPSRWILAPIEAVKSLVRRRRFLFFPDEIMRLRSKRQAAEFMTSEGFEVTRVDFSWRTAFIHMVLVARKPAQPFPS